MGSLEAEKKIYLLRGRRACLREIKVTETLSVSILESEEQDAIIEEAIEQDLPAPYGLICWPSAIRVAKVVASIPRLRDLQVLDLGAGNGLPSLTAATLGATVLATDIHSLTMLLIEKAAKIASLNNLQTQYLNILETKPLPAHDLLLAADMLYEPELAEATALRCIESLTNGGSLIVGAPNRRARERFLHVLRHHGFSAEFIDKPVLDHLTMKERAVSVWRAGPIFERDSNE